MPTNHFIAIVNSYKRPQNIQRIVDALLASKSIQHIFINNNNTSLKIENYILVSKNTVTCINQQEDKGASVRFEIANLYMQENCLALDDDVFLTTTQVNNLMLHFINMTCGNVLGFWGEKKDYSSGLLVGNRYRFNGTLEVLNLGYLFSKNHLDNYFLLLKELQNEGINKQEWIDDMILSFSGSSNPRCIDIGPIAICQSSKDPNIATHKKEGFQEYRNQVFTLLKTKQECQVK
jgi:Glycosyl transferase family 64 domain